MNKYGQSAVFAATMIKNNSTIEPSEAWMNAVIEFFPNSKESQKKSCPKSTFLGICGSGLIDGIPIGSYTKSIDNKKYGLDAIAALRLNPALAKDKKTIWTIIMNGVTKKENSQMDVVIALWNEGLVK